MNEEVLLLGGTGFIGSALAKRLRQEDITAHSLGRHQVDGLDDILPRCSTVVHLASGTTPGSSAAQPHLELGNVNLTSRLLMSSSGSIHGTATAA